MHLSEQSFLKRGLTLLVGFALATSIVVPVKAQQEIAIGTPSTSDNAFPFGTGGPNDFPDYAAGGEYQEIYSSTDFKSLTPLSISGIAFASSSRFQSPVAATYDVTIGLSNTNATIGTASSFFSANKGANYQTVFSGTLTTTLTNDNTFDLFFPTAPFVFDPSKGNLLFDVVINTPTSANGIAEFLENNGFETERVYDSFGIGTSGQGFTQEPGLYTQFTVTPVPEASITVSFGLLLALGLGGIVIAKKKKQSAVV